MKSKGFWSALMIILVALLACQSKDASTLPHELLGVWKTTVPKYKDCSFILKQGFVIYLSGELLENIDVNFISRIDKSPRDKGTLYTLYCLKEKGQEFIVSFYYYPEKGGLIRFKNQNRIDWKRDKRTK
jgi:hypothetical protein